MAISANIYIINESIIATANVLNYFKNHHQPNLVHLIWNIIIKKIETETLRQNVSNISQKNLNLKIRSNLTKDERRVLKELQKDGKLKSARI